MQGNEHFKQLQQQLSTALKQGMKRLRSKMNSLQSQMGSTEESQQIQKQADLLTANLYRYHLLPPSYLLFFHGAYSLYVHSATKQAA